MLTSYVQLVMNTIVWRSQPMQKRFYVENLKLIAAVLFSSNTHRKLSKYFEILDIPWVSKSWYYRINEKYMLGITDEAWHKEQELIFPVQGI